MSKKLVMIITICLSFVTVVLNAKVRSINTKRDFEQSVAQERMAVAFFYDIPNKDLMRMYEDVSKRQRYDDADVVFLKVNAGRQDLFDLAQVYGITTMPAFVFFHKGKRLTDKGKPVILTGSIMRDQLESSIDTYYGDEIDRYITQKEVRKEKRITRENESWKPYFYPRDIFVPGYDPAERNLE